MELGEGERDLMKMLMQNDQPEETIQRPMEDPAMVQSGVRKDQILYFVGPVIFRTMLVIRSAHVRWAWTIRSFTRWTEMDSLKKLSVFVGREMLLPWRNERCTVLCNFGEQGLDIDSRQETYISRKHDTDENWLHEFIERNSTGCSERWHLHKKLFRLSRAHR